MDKVSADATDHSLIAAFKAGSTEAIDKIVERYENPIFTFGLKMCGHLQDAEDIVQETFFSAFKYLESFKIAARACMRKRRKKKCEPDREISLESLIHKDGSEGKYEIPDWSDDPSDNVLRAELKEVIDNAILSLPPKYRLVFNLRDTEGFNTEETAELLEISKQSVKTRLHRARLFLREKIISHYREGEIQ